MRSPGADLGRGAVGLRRSGRRGRWLAAVETIKIHPCDYATCDQPAGRFSFAMGRAALSLPDTKRAVTAGLKVSCQISRSAATVPASSAPIMLEYPTTSAARMAESRRVVCCSTIPVPHSMG